MAVVPLLCRDHLEGLLLIGLQAHSFRALTSQAGALQMVAGHAAIAFQLERIRREQSERIASERLQAATLVARKIGHEINNPLAILRNYLHILERKISQGQDIVQELAIIDGELERLAQVTRGLDDLSREHTPPRREQIDLHRHLRTILTPFQAALPPESQIVLTLQPSAHPVVLDLDPGHLHQIVHNLVQNSLDALQSKGTITLRTEIDRNQVRIHVEDDGPGIDPAHFNDIFNAGFSTKNDTHRGLGLSIAAALAKQMGGTLSGAVLNGTTTFTLALPT
jgi:signal transduction histidine kinase